MVIRFFNMTETRIPSWREAWLPLWLFALYATYPVPHTVALRNLLLAVGLAGLILAARPWRESLAGLGSAVRWARPAAIMLMLLTGWMLVQSAFLSPFPDRALPLLSGQWTMILLAVFLGLAAAYRQPRATLQALTLALSAHIALLLLYQLYLAGFHDPAAGYTPATPFAERDYHSLLNGSLFALLLGDRWASMNRVAPPLGLPGRLVWTLLLSSLLADVFLRTRNGTLVTVALVGLAVVWLATNGQRQLRFLTIVAALVLVLVLGMSLRNDERWSGLVESVTLGVTSGSLYGLDATAPPPATPSGQPLEESAYDRAVWATQAVEAIVRHPLGLGFGHQAFGWAVELKYGLKGMESSHSGWLDFALANGLPGLALWLAMSGWLMLAGWRRFRNLGDGNGLLLVLTVFAYLLRCLIDGHLSGWRLAMYALLVGAIIGASGRQREPA